jgi:hypothetical protein
MLETVSVCILVIEFPSVVIMGLYGLHIVNNRNDVAQQKTWHILRFMQPFIGHLHELIRE